MSQTPSSSPAEPAVVIRTARDVVDAINSGRVRGGNERAIILIALGGIFIDAYDFTSLAFGLSDIAEQFDLDAVEHGVVGASIMVGALLGALFGGYLVDKIGRYKMFMADMVFFVIAALACAFAPNAETLTLARFIMGVGIGLDFPVALAFIAEYSALRGKGGRVTLWQPMWYIATGTSFAVLLPMYFLLPESAHGDLWRWAVGFGAVPALVVMLVRHRYMEESASWAAKQGKLERAVQILRNSYGVDAVLAEDAVREQATEPPAWWRGIKQLFTRRYRKRTILAGVLSATQAAQYYAVGFALPFIIGSFLGQDTLTTIIGPLIFNFVFGVTGGFAGVALAARLGSWGLSVSGFVVCLVALPPLALIGEPTGTGGIIAAGALLGVFVFFHAYGPGAQGMTMATLSYPTSLRGTGSGFGQMALRIGSTTSLLLFPVLSDALGTGVFWVVMIAPALGLLTLLLIRWEPIGTDVDAEDFADPADSAGPAGPAREDG
ncbi:putative MFS family arabinose efflux permease [Tamaricihabitans halophyticus]|uniref:Putative MFS family arabinose efflux permease n=1 Tax=Tamaricihabitans halophyticus TaxID=1262583 RepID=A0A4R2R145_9PSEU|nr:MFS transporter [Tamaricihabitans halophyticus]TCP53171.1 putative MFS family arabinose efflux permease [Tamaricihabitans halophyticus]